MKALSVGFSRSREVEFDASGVSPHNGILGDELRSLIDADRPWIADFRTDALERRDDIGAREADLAAVVELVVHDIHRPHVVGASGRRATFT